ncbi:DUF4097 domain-containing protein [Paenibacillus oenotherae]|uniref:DUF4097 domain-containing protein n=1 Tax=Paenibacillus oenotherae TaxID=1435645 RepID=A0ABS7D893_9BACL|nr:DUF4097 family beta strand repeat-containing protein [Paenibacillus oenotherae]MBW7476034.1 DUF4097 domain-containing protein [Paenibacillus oenotherae]
MRNWIVVALILIVVGLIGISSSFSFDGLFSMGAVEYNKEESVDGAGVKRIQFDVGSMDLEIVPGSSEEIKARISGEASKKYKDKIILKLERDGDTVKVEADTNEGFSIGVNIMDLDLRVEIPARKWEQIVLDMGSGNLDVRDIAANSFKATGGSGDFTVEGIEADEFSTELGSGNVSLNELTAKNVEVIMSSGNTTLDKVKADKVSVDGGSGNVELVDSGTELKANVSSGNISVELDEIKHAMNLDTGSGDVTIATDKEPASARFEFNPGSGELYNKWNEQEESSDDEGDQQVTFGAGDIEIQVSTGSGNLTIEQR